MRTETATKLNDDFRLALVVKSKNGVLWEAAQRLGGVRNLAKKLGLRYGYLIGLMNMRIYPGFRSEKASLNWAEIEKKLVEVTGLLLEDVFPPELAESEFLQQPRTRSVVVDIPRERIEQLGKAHETLAIAPPQEEEQDLLALRKVAEDVLETIGPRREKVMKMRFGLAHRHRNDEHVCRSEHSLDEIGEEFGVGRERIRQIEAKALRLLRHPFRAKHLKPFIDWYAEDPDLPRVEAAESPVDEETEAVPQCAARSVAEGVQCTNQADYMGKIVVTNSPFRLGAQQPVCAKHAGEFEVAFPGVAMLTPISKSDKT